MISPKNTNKQISETLKRVSENYFLKGTFADFTQKTNGHINDTYLVKFSVDTDTYEELIFQRINDYVFKDPVSVMENIKQITLHVKNKKTENDCDIITFMDNLEGKNYTICEGSYWRVCKYVNNSVTYETAEDSKILRSAGYAFGRFQYLLSDFPMNKLHETIPNFHNTKKRLDDLFETVEKDPVGRVSSVKEDIVFFYQYKKEATKLIDMQEKGQLPLRVTHNDTKYNNILMHKDTKDPMCVIDLDTVMPGLSMYDYGDAIRFAANTAVEDEQDLSKVGLNMENYEEFTNGFITASGELLTKNEKNNMALGSIVITIELASRFLSDHINGDLYFKIHRDNHNLERARCQIKLAKDMILKYDKMCNIVSKYS